MSLSKKNGKTRGITGNVSFVVTLKFPKLHVLNLNRVSHLATLTKREGFFYLIGGDDGKSLAPWINVRCRWVVGRKDGAGPMSARNYLMILNYLGPAGIQCYNFLMGQEPNIGLKKYVFGVVYVALGPITS